MDSTRGSGDGGRAAMDNSFSGASGLGMSDGVDYETAARFFGGGDDAAPPAVSAIPESVANQLSSLSDFRISFALTDVASVLKYVISELNLTKAHMAMLGARAGDTADVLARAKDLDVSTAKLSDDVAVLRAPDGPLAALESRMEAKDGEIAALKAALAEATATAAAAAASAQQSAESANAATAALQELSARHDALAQRQAALEADSASASSSFATLAVPRGLASPRASNASVPVNDGDGVPLSPAGSSVGGSGAAYIRAGSARREDDLQRQISSQLTAFNTAHAKQQEFNTKALHSQLDLDRRLDALSSRLAASTADRAGAPRAADDGEGGLLPGPSSSSGNTGSGLGFSREEAEAYLREAAQGAAAAALAAAAGPGSPTAGGARRHNKRSSASVPAPAATAASVAAVAAAAADASARDVMSFAQSEFAAVKRRLHDAETLLDDLRGAALASTRKEEQWARAEQFHMLVAQITGLLTKQGRHEDELGALRQRVDGELQLSGPLDMSAMRRNLIAINAKQRQTADKVDTLSALVMTTRKQVAQQGSFETSPLVKSLNLRLYEFEMKFNELEDKLTLLAHYVAKLKPSLATATVAVVPQGHSAVGAIVTSAAGAGAGFAAHPGGGAGGGTMISGLAPGSALGKGSMDARLLDSDDPDAVEGIHLKLLSRFTVRGDGAANGSGSAQGGAGNAGAGADANSASVHRSLTDLARDIGALSDLQSKLHDARALLARLDDLSSLEGRVQSLLDLDVPQRLSYLERKFNTEVSFLKAHLAAKVDQGNVQILLARVDALVSRARPALLPQAQPHQGQGQGQTGAGTAQRGAGAAVPDSIFAGADGSMDPALSAAIQRGRAYAVAPRPQAGAAPRGAQSLAQSAGLNSTGAGAAGVSGEDALDPAMQRLFALLSLKAGTDTVDKVEELARAFDRQNRDGLLRVIAELQELRHAVMQQQQQQQQQQGQQGQQQQGQQQGQQRPGTSGPEQGSNALTVAGPPKASGGSPANGGAAAGGASAGPSSAMDFLAGPIERLQQQLEFVSVTLAAHDAALAKKCDVETVEDVQHTMLQKVLEMCELKDAPSASARRTAAADTDAAATGLRDGVSLEVVARLHTHVEDLSARLRSHKEWIMRNAQDVQSLRDWVRYAHDVLQTQAQAHPAIKQLEGQLAQLKRRVGNNTNGGAGGVERMATASSGFSASPRTSLQTPLAAGGRAGTAAGGSTHHSHTHSFQHSVSVNHVNFMANRHSMLSSKPLDGFKCMSCDRPLETLEKTAPPPLPTQQLPRHLTSVVPAGGVAGDAVRVRIAASHSPERVKDTEAPAKPAGAAVKQGSAAPSRLPQI